MHRRLALRTLDDAAALRLAAVPDPEGDDDPAELAQVQLVADKLEALAVQWLTQGVDNGDG